MVKDDDDDVKRLGNISVEFANGHLWSLIMPYLGCYNEAVKWQIIWLINFDQNL